MAMADAALPTRRRWFRFSLATMLLMMLTVASLVFGFRERVLRWQSETVLREHERLFEMKAAAREADWTRSAIEQKNIIDEQTRIIRAQERRLVGAVAREP
jgi:hypothetical protein